MIRIKSSVVTLTAAAVLLSFASHASAVVATWKPAVNTGTWTTGTNWVGGTAPSVAGDSAIFNADATASRSITGATGSVGSISVDNTSVAANNQTTSIAGTLTMDETGAGPATITVSGNGTKLTTISAMLVLTDSLDVNITDTSSTSAAGALTLSGTFTGGGGLTKTGDGMATLSTAVKAYTGATALNGGRLRISPSGIPSATSSFTVNSGGQLLFLTAGGSFTFGGNVNVPLNLNGAGVLTGPFAAFPGAIRPETGTISTVNNVTDLQSDTVIHVQANGGTGSSASPVGQVTFTNVIGGIGKLTFTASGSNIDQGSLILNGANTYAGGTLVQGGILLASGATATFGTGNVTVDSTATAGSIARIQISAGVANAIANGATLSLLGGGAAGVADQNFAILGTGINEYIAALILGGASQSYGTYGSTASPAMFQSDEFFSGLGIITVVPEASAFLLAGLIGGVFGLGRLIRKVGR